MFTVPSFPQWTTLATFSSFASDHSFLFVYFHENVMAGILSPQSRLLALNWARLEKHAWTGINLLFRMIPPTSLHFRVSVLTSELLWKFHLHLTKRWTLSQKKVEEEMFTNMQQRIFITLESPFVFGPVLSSTTPTRSTVFQETLF